MFTRIKSFFNLRPQYTIILFFTIIALFFVWLHASAAFADPDAFYHIGVAEHMRSHGLVIPSFEWLPLTTLSHSFADQAWLYHVLLIPFTFFNNPLIGLTVATIIISTAVISALYTLLKSLHTIHPLLVTSIAVVTMPFIVRISFAKAAPLGTFLFLLGLITLFKQKPLWLGFLSVVYVWTHGSWPVLLVAVFISWLVSICYNRTSWKSAFGSIHARLLYACFAGCMAGMTINPYFPNNIIFFWQQTVLIAVHGLTNTLAVGAEWYGYPFAELISFTLLVLILFIGATVLFASVRSSRTHVRWTLWILALVLLAATLKSRRYVEFFVPIALTFSGSMTPIVINYWDRIRYYVNEWQKQNRVLLVVVYIAIFLLPFIVVRDVIIAHSTLAGAYQFDTYHTTAQWLKQHTTPDTMIINSDFADFPQLWYQHRSGTYLTGLDPVFLYLASPELYSTWDALIHTSSNYSPDMLQPYISDSFIVLVSHNQPDTAERLRGDPEWELKYEDADAWIFVPVLSE